jgi:hypothetical protein
MTLRLSSFAARNTVRVFSRTPMGWVAAVPDVQQRKPAHVRIWSPPVLVSVRKHRGGHAKNA